MATTISRPTEAPTVAERPQPRVRRKLNLTPWLFLAVPLVIYLLWVIGPLFASFYISMTNWDGVDLVPKFTGLDNYIKLFGDPPFQTALLNNLKVLLVFTTIPVIGGLSLAMLLNRTAIGVKLIKALIYSPVVLSFVVIGLIWSWMYHPADGMINSTLRAVGLDSLTQGWLSNPDLTLFSIIAAACWRQIGYVMVLYLAGLTTVDPTLIEAARVDGANKWQQFRHVTLPLLAPITVVVVVITVIDSLRFFDLVFVMTKGGPGYASTVLANFMYIEAFNNYKYGYGAAIAVVQFLISFVFIIIYLTRVLREEVEF